MLFIHENIIHAKDLKPFIDNASIKYKTAKDVLSTIISDNSNKVFYDNKKLEYDYKITVASKEQLETFMEFFKKYPLLEDEYICIKRHDINLKDTYEIINKYNNYEFIENIYVEQLDKNEFSNFEDYSIIYNFFKKFERMLPENPTKIDIIINAYDYIKSREYFEEKDKKSILSKQFSTSVTTPYIVCAGFVKQFNCILKEYGIPCYEYQFMNENNIGHDVSLVYVEGYGIYFFDITKDSYDPKDQTDYLKNESKYSGFMLPHTYYLNSIIKKDNFDKELLKNPKLFDLKKRYANQQSYYKNDKIIDVFNKKEFDKTYLLQTLIDVDYELIKCENLFDNVSDYKELMTAEIYNALITLNSNFGEEITDIDLFIDMLISAKKNTNLYNNKTYYIKSIISRYLNNEKVNLSEATNKVMKKI